MNFQLNSFMIDVIFLSFCFIFSVYGYLKGFIYRFYDLMGLILSFIIAYFSYEYVSNVFSFFPVNDLTQNIFLFPIINNFISFIVIFIVLYLIIKLLGILIKPLLEKILSFLTVTDFINSFLGFILSFFESLLISYIVFLLMMTPLMSNGYELINDTVLAKEFLNIVPDHSSEIVEWSNDYFSIIKDNFNINDDNTIQFIKSTYDLGLLNETQINNIIDNPQFNDTFRIKLQKEMSDMYEK